MRHRNRLTALRERTLTAEIRRIEVRDATSSRATSRHGVRRG